MYEKRSLQSQFLKGTSPHPQFKDSILSVFDLSQSETGSDLGSYIHFPEKNILASLLGHFENSLSKFLFVKALIKGSIFGIQVILIR